MHHESRMARMQQRIVTADKVWTFVEEATAPLALSDKQRQCITKFFEMIPLELLTGKNTQALATVELEPLMQILVIQLNQAKDGQVTLNGKFMRLEIEEDGFCSLKSHQSKSVTAAHLA